MSERSIFGAALLQVIEQVYRAGDSNRALPRALRSVCDAVNASAALIAWYGVGRGGCVVGSWNIPRPLRDAYADRFAVAELRHVGDPVTCRWSTMPPAGVPEDLAGEFRDAWLRPQGLGAAVQAEFYQLGSIAFHVALFRPEGGGAFADAELKAVEAMLPHLRRAAELRNLHVTFDEQRKGLFAALDRLPTGVMLVGRDGSLLAANSLAERCLAQGDALVSEPGGIRVQTDTGPVLIERVVAEMFEAGDDDRSVPRVRAMTASRETGARPLSLVFVPTVAEDRPMGWDTPVAAVLLSDPEDPPQLDLAHLKAIYRLTAAETEILAEVARGYRPDEVATLRGVSYETVRTHLKRIYGKLGVDRQADLVRMVYSGSGLIERRRDSIRDKGRRQRRPLRLFERSTEISAPEDGTDYLPTGGQRPS